MGFWAELGADLRSGFNDGSQSMLDEIRRIMFGYDRSKSDDNKTIETIEEKYQITIPENKTSGQSGLIGGYVNGDNGTYGMLIVAMIVLVWMALKD